MHFTGLVVFSTRDGRARQVWHTHRESGTVAMGTVEVGGERFFRMENGGRWLDPVT